MNRMANFWRHLKMVLSKVWQVHSFLCNHLLAKVKHLRFNHRSWGFQHDLNAPDKLHLSRVRWNSLPKHEFLGDVKDNSNTTGRGSGIMLTDILDLSSWQVSNTFYFTFSLDPECVKPGVESTVRRVLPATEEEARNYLARYEADHLVPEPADHLQSWTSLAFCLITFTQEGFRCCSVLIHKDELLYGRGNHIAACTCTL